MNSYTTERAPRRKRNAGSITLARRLSVAAVCDADFPTTDRARLAAAAANRSVSRVVVDHAGIARLLRESKERKRVAQRNIAAVHVVTRDRAIRHDAENDVDHV